MQTPRPTFCDLLLTAVPTDRPARESLPTAPLVTISWYGPTVRSGSMGAGTYVSTATK